MRSGILNLLKAQADLQKLKEKESQFENAQAPSILSNDVEVTRLLEAAARKLEEALENFIPDKSEQALAQADKIIEASFHNLSQNPALQQRALSATHLETQENVLIYLLTHLHLNNKISREKKDYLCKAIDTKDTNKNQRLDAMSQIFDVCPTVCLLRGEGDKGKTFGHITVGRRIKHDLVLTALKPPPSNSDEKTLRAYINALAIHPDHNAYISFENEMYYLDRARKKNALVPLFIDNPSKIEAFNKAFIHQGLNTDEESKHIKEDLSFTEIRELKSILNLSTPPRIFLEYFSYEGIEDQGLLGSFSSSTSSSKSSKENAKPKLSLIVGTYSNDKFWSEVAKGEYGHNCLMIDMPPTELRLYNMAKQEFAKKDRLDYSVLNNNCAHAVSGFLKNAGYLPETQALSTLPYSAATQAFKIKRAKIKEEREAILNSPEISPHKQILQLLKNDMQRLQEQINLAAAHFLPQNIDSKNKKLEVLKQVIELFKSETLGISTHGFIQLIQAKEKMGPGISAQHLQECIDKFPFYKLKVGKDTLIGLREQLTPDSRTTKRGIFSNVAIKHKLSDKEIYIEYFKMQYHQQENKDAASNLNLAAKNAGSGAG